MDEIYNYYKVKDLEYIGERYFQVSFADDYVLQVVITTSEYARRGRTNTPGITLMSRTSFATNYFGSSKLQPSTYAEFNKAFNQLVEILRPAGRHRKYKK